MTTNPADSGKTGEDLVFGKNAVKSALETLPERCSMILLSDKIPASERDDLIAACKKSGVRWQSVKAAVVERLCPGVRHQGVVAKVLPVVLTDLDDFFEGLAAAGGPALIIFADHVQDPQNLGALARSSEVFGAAGIVIPKRRSVLPTSTVMRTSSGAIARIPVVGIVNAARALREFKEKGFWIMGLDHCAEDILWECEIPEKAVLVVGSEGRGISRLTRENCDFLVRIPMRGRTGSLNAATAGAIGMYEWFRTLSKGWSGTQGNTGPGGTRTGCGPVDKPRDRG